jgi:phosphoserine phosphatase RsbU/P
MIIIAFFLLRIKIFRDAINHKKAYFGKIFLGIMFGILAIYGSYSGIQFRDAIINVRDLAPLIAGILGGPISGIFAGLIGGTHRYFIGGFVAIPCALATVLAGIFAGIFSKKIRGKNILVLGPLLSFFIESMHMILILIIATPFTRAFNLVEQISLPMILGNTIGLWIFIYFFRSGIFSKKKDSLADGANKDTSH